MGFDPMLNPIHARDVVRALHSFVHRRVKGVFNIVGKDIAPLSAFIRMAAGQRIGLPGFAVAPVARLLRRAHLTRFDERCGVGCLSHHCLLDGGHAREVLHFEPKYHVKFQT
jgi:UDP-glucose 4-epimerase